MRALGFTAEGAEVRRGSQRERRRGCSHRVLGSNAIRLRWLWSDPRWDLFPLCKRGIEGDWGVRAFGQSGMLTRILPRPPFAKEGMFMGCLDVWQRCDVQLSGEHARRPSPRLVLQGWRLKKPASSGSSRGRELWEPPCPKSRNLRGSSACIPQCTSAHLCALCGEIPHG